MAAFCIKMRCNMQKVIYREEVPKYAEYFEKPVADYICEGLVETYEGFDKYSLVAFDWYNIDNLEEEPAQILVYIDEEDLFYICENDRAFEVANKNFVASQTNEKALYFFFKNMFKGDLRYVEKLEDELEELDDLTMKGEDEKTSQKIVDLRYNVLRLRKYYHQLAFMFEELCEDDTEAIGEEYMKYFEILKNRCVNLESSIENMWDYIIQIRSTYQAQVDIEQNHLMKVFTMVTSIFLPLTLVAGWYGMNLKMPEFEWEYGYPIMIGVCAIIIVVWYIVFKKKKWFK